MIRYGTLRQDPTGVAEHSGVVGLWTWELEVPRMVVAAQELVSGSVKGGRSTQGGCDDGEVGA